MKKIIAIIAAAGLVIGAATGVAVYFLKANLDKEPLVVTATYDELTLGDSLFYYIDQNKDRWGNVLVSQYGMSEDEKESLLNNPEEWLAFTLFIDVENTNNKEVLMSSVDIPKNGKDKIYIQNVLEGISVADANTTTSICLNVFVHDPDPSLDEIFDILKTTEINLLYYAAPEDIDEEVPAEDMFSTQVK